MLRDVRTLMACTNVVQVVEPSVTSAASTRSAEAPGSGEEVHPTWSVADFAWDGEELFQVCRFSGRVREASRARRR